MKITKKSIETFVVENPAYYCRAFEKIQKDKLSWNWAAALWGSSWALYRGMYLYGVLIMLLECGLDWIFKKYMLGFLPFSWLLSFAILPVCGVLFYGMMGNRLYFYFLQQRLTKGHKEEGIHNWVIALPIILLIFSTLVFPVMVVLFHISDFFPSIIGKIVSIWSALKPLLN